MQLVERITSATYKAPAGTIPAVPGGETADRVAINVDGVQYVWKRNSVGMYYRYAGPIGWLTDEDRPVMYADLQEAQAHG